MAYNLTYEEIREFWDRYAAAAAMLARRFGKGTPATNDWIRKSGGIRPTIPCRAERHLTLEERKEISRGLASGLSLRRIAEPLGRGASTVAREVNNNGGRTNYRATKADQAAVKRRRGPKVCKLKVLPRLHDVSETNWQRGGLLNRSPGG